MTSPTAKVFPLFTDGFWSRDDEGSESVEGQFALRTLRIIKIGADANPKLKGSEMFSSDELFSALDGWFEENEGWA